MTLEFGSSDIGKAYDSQANLFDNYAHSSPEWDSILRPNIVANLREFVNPTTQIVDLGCGSGRLVKTLIKMGAEESNVKGIDISRKLITKAKKRFPNSKFVNGDLVDIELETNYYDLVASSMVFQGMDNESLRKTLINAYNCLKVGGLLYFITTHPLDSADFDPELYGSGWFETQTPWGELTPNYRRTTVDYINAMQNAGFSIEKIDELARRSNIHEGQEDLYRIAFMGKKL